MEKNKRILFIAWDGPYVSYLESLFVPIFSELKKDGFEFHIIQFSWASNEKVNTVQLFCQERGIPYTHYRVYVMPHPLIGKLITLAFAREKISNYINKNDINIVMPRAMMPAGIVLRLLKKFPSKKVIFDADGLQIEERVDFAGLKTESIRYKQLKKIEGNIIGRANAVLTRTIPAKDFLVEQYGTDISSKVFRVVNGRDEKVFKRADNDQIRKIRSQLNIPEHAHVSVYCGSLAPQYGLPEMARLHSMMLKSNPHAYWLVLTSNTAEMRPYLNVPNVIVRTVNSLEVPLYLSAANIGLAFRKATFSMKGVAPIKLGEYMMVGLPVIASAGIGDTEDLLTSYSFCHILSDFSDASLIGAHDWMLKKNNSYDSSEIRNAGLQCFSLKSAVESYRDALDSIL